MPKPFNELRERLLRAGVAPRHVRRYLRELADHFADLTAEEERAGRSHSDANSAALARLGSMDDLAQAMIAKPQLRSWCSRAPWVAFGVMPPFALAAAYFIGCIYLWCGWRSFLPGLDTPFGAVARGPVYSLQNIYFQAGKYYYICAPVLAGCGVAVIAARQRLKAVWPLIGLVLIASMGATAHIQASRTAVPHGLGHISMRFFVPGPSARDVSFALLHALIIFTLVALPYLIWRLRFARCYGA
jgi:hypothetical protein